MSSTMNDNTNTIQATAPVTPISDMQMQGMPAIKFGGTTDAHQAPTISISGESGPIQIENSPKSIRSPEANIETTKPLENKVEFNRENPDFEKRDARPEPVLTTMQPAATDINNTVGTTAVTPEPPVKEEIKLPPIQGYKIEGPEKFIEEGGWKKDKNIADTALHYLVQRLLRIGREK